MASQLLIEFTRKNQSLYKAKFLTISDFCCTDIVKVVDEAFAFNTAFSFSAKSEVDDAARKSLKLISDQCVAGTSPLYP